MFWRLFIAGFVLNKRYNRYIYPSKMSEITINEGFTGTKGAVKPRSSLDVTDLRSVKSTDDEPVDDGNDFLRKIIAYENLSSLEEILVEKEIKKKQPFFNSGRDERYGIIRDDMILNITLFNHQMKLLRKLESEKISNIDKLVAITQYRNEAQSGEYLIQIKKSGLMKDWDFPPIK